jgi:hypothetical protein
MTPSYALGLVFIFLVSIIWSASSIVVQHLYHDMQFDSPFILTYVGTSLFVIFVPMRLLWERRRRIRTWCFGRRKSREGWTFVRQSDSQDEEGPPTNSLQEPAEEKIVIIPWRSSSVSQMRRRGNARDGTTVSIYHILIREGVLFILIQFSLTSLSSSLLPYRFLPMYHTI